MKFSVFRIQFSARKNLRPCNLKTENRILKTSIYLPARDAESTIGLAIESCLAQTLPDFELVLVDHGSIDGTYSLMKKYARRDSRIDVLKQQRGISFVNVLNFAWRETGADLVARMDADDFSYPARLQYQVRFLEENPELSACGAHVRIRKRHGGRGRGAPVLPDQGYAVYEKWLNSLVTPEQVARERFVDSPVSNPTAVIRRPVLERFGGFEDPPWAEDYDFWLRLLEAGERIGKVDRVLLDWHDSESRSTRTVERYTQDNFQRAKAHYVARLPLVRERGVSICGAGPIGKKLGRRLREEHGVTVGAFFEVNENRIGKKIGGVPVFSNEALSDAPRRVLIGAVGQPGARARIRELAEETGYEEGTDFFCVA